MDEKARADNRLRQQRYRELHRQELNDKRRELYDERKLNNKCPRCGGKVKKGHTLCAACCDYQGSLNQKYAEGRKAVTKTVKTQAAKKSAQVAAAKKTVKAAAVKKTSAVKARASAIKKTAK